MIYAAFTFWLLVIVFSAYGVYQLWSGMIKQRFVNMVLLPGTLVAQLGHVVGLLITGGTVNDTSLIKDDETAEPTTSPNPQSRVPVLGPIVVALLPLVACGVSIYAVVQWLGSEVLGPGEIMQVSMTLPNSIPGFWELLRGSITLIEDVTATISGSDFDRWQTWLFVYLLICLTVRMAPFAGTQRGAIGAILLLGLSCFVVSLAVRGSSDSLQPMWTILSISVGSLLFLMLVTLMIRGVVGLVRILANQTS